MWSNKNNAQGVDKLTFDENELISKDFINNCEFFGNVNEK